MNGMLARLKTRSARAALTVAKIDVVAYLPMGRRMSSTRRPDAPRFTLARSRKVDHALVLIRIHERRPRSPDLLTAGLAGVALSTLPGTTLAQSGARAPDAPRSGEASVAAHRIEVPMPSGGVTAGHPLAAMAGTRMLMQGGTAADAMVAAMAVMNVVEPWASSAGGNGFATCLDRKTGKVLSLAFTGGAPRLLDPDVDPALLDHRPKALAVPGAFGAWIALARRFGKLPLSTLLAPAIAYATPPRSATWRRLVVDFCQG